MKVCPISPCHGPQDQWQMDAVARRGRVAAHKDLIALQCDRIGAVDPLASALAAQQQADRYRVGQASAPVEAVAG